MIGRRKSMSERRHFFLVSSLTVLIVLGLGTTIYAGMPLTFYTGNQYLSLNSDNQLGYTEGAVDMLRGLQDAGWIGPSNDPQVLAIINCVAKSTDVQIDAMLKSYIHNNPGHADNNAATMIYNAMRIACNIN